MILQFLAERVRQAREPAHRHSYAEVRALHVRRADVLRIGITFHYVAFAGCADRRALALLAFGRVAVNLRKLCIVDVIAKRAIYRRQINLQTVRRLLNATGHATCKVFDARPNRLFLPILRSPKSPVTGL